MPRLGPISVTEEGKVRGRIVKSPETGVTYVSFQGIPYARPPVGPLRFKPPEPVQPWRGVRECEKEGNVCIQHHMYMRDLRGSEDCLYLNVYTPHLNLFGVSRKPVMVRIHGGGFTTGSGGLEMSGPDFFLKEGIVVVTLNYRLNIFGFLSLDEPGDAQGNMGMKDQVMALQWVKRNIINFGGDPNKITIAGESAGGASVHLHMMSPMSQGLFSNAIAESGVAINPWAFTNESKKRAFHLAKYLGFSGTSNKELLEFLRSRPAEELVLKGNHAFSKEDKEYVCVISPFPFVPVVEKSNGSVEPFLAEHPMKLLNEGRFFKGPFLAGVNNREGMLLMAGIMGKDRGEMLVKFDKRISKLVPAELNLPRGSPEEDAIVQKLRQFYMKGMPANEDNLSSYFDLCGDLMFLHGFHRAMELHTAVSSPYLYEFSYEGSLNVFRNVLGESVSGACHADNLGYLFAMDLLPSTSKLPPNSLDLITRRRMVRLWANFVKTGNPTPTFDKLLRVKWIPSRKGKRAYLEIGKTLENHVGSIADARMTFWDDIYNKIIPVRLMNKL